MATQSLRRSSRQSTRPIPSPPVAPSLEKRKAPEPIPPEEQLKKLLEDAKSPLTTTNITDVINVRTWTALSDESKAALLPLLPPTAFRDYVPALGPEHPAYIKNESSVAATADHLPRLPANVDLAVFNDAHFVSAAQTFQDHIFSGWMTPAQTDKVRQYTERVRDGSLAAPWKDEEWHRSQANEEIDISSNRAMLASEVKLCDLAREGVVQEGDILAYSRRFSHFDVVVQKDVLVQNFNPRSSTLTVLFQPGEEMLLPSEIVRRIGPEDPCAPTQSADISSPSALETALLDSDGRVPKRERPNGNAWKCFTVWRWSGEVEMMVDLGLDDARGGRESHGTLFYLRGSHSREK